MGDPRLNRDPSKPVVGRVTPEDPDWGWPIGWVVTYLVGDPTGTGGPGAQVGVITRRAEQSATTGRVLIPVRDPTDPPQVVIAWVDESDVVRLSPPHLVDAGDPDPHLLP